MSAAVHGEAAALTSAEVEFVRTVTLLPGHKLAESQSFDYSGEVAHALWNAPERAGLIECVGSYKWQPTPALLDAIGKASRQVIEALGISARAADVLNSQPQVLATGGIAKPVAAHDDPTLLSKDAFTSPLCHRLYQSEIESYRRALRIFGAPENAAVIERAIRFIESGSHTQIARDTMTNELRKLLPADSIVPA